MQLTHGSRRNAAAACSRLAGKNGHIADGMEHLRRSGCYLLCGSSRLLNLLVNVGRCVGDSIKNIFR
ncbi:hypothetical protein [Priestia megaterium]|uniref:hypothetical protein n=1 Tax=Priestia megaterium TaxID=1404 RepID=UPI001155A073|nr:hypothetical protein [Priestia megaterium]